jgi:CBS domain-containing protein
MGEQNINVNATLEERVAFSRDLLNDLESLEYMVRNDMIEKGPIRIGAEQEFCLVNEHWRPASNAVKILEAIDDEHFTSELAIYNLEINLDPVVLEGKAFQEVENQLSSLLAKAKVHAEANGSKIVLAGILPSLSMHEVNMDFITPMPRYFALNETMRKQRGTDFQMNFAGVDELSLSHNSVMFEACNTSFQLHLQIAPDDFTASYNWSQAISGPVLGVCANSPLLFGKELWSETRIALFQQSIDTRSFSSSLKNKNARVSFGEDWLRGGILEYYRGEVSKFPNLITKDIETKSMDELKAGRIPKLRALNLFNGTVYRWNRPCYGVGGGKPHIRIENRYIPSGPTIVDEMANFAFWVGLMKGRPAEFDAIHELMEFEEAKSNFIHAARNGSETIMNWMGKRIPLPELIKDVMLPIARKGLEKMNVDSAEIDRYFNIILGRLETHTGAQWGVENYRKLKRKYQADDASLVLTKAMYTHQQTGKAISEWSTNADHEIFNSKASKVGHIMSTSLVTGDHRDSALLTVQLMKWNNIHHLPIVDNNERLLGIITWSHIDQFWDDLHQEDNHFSASDIMIQEVISVTTRTPIEEAKSLMRDHKIGCLPVLEDDQVVGIITLNDV